MAAGVRRPHEAVDFAAVERMFPPPPEYFEGAFFDRPEVIERRQLSRLIDKAWRAYAIPFHRRRWDAAGFDPRDLTTLDDLAACPAYTVDDIRRSIEAHPPYGDYQGVTPELATREPMRVYMSGGTTGQSRPTFYTAWDRDVGASAHRPRALPPRHPARRHGAQLVELLHPQRRVELRRGALQVAQLRRAHHRHRQRHQHREAGASWPSSTAPPPSSPPATTSCASPTSPKEMGYDPAVDLKISALPNIGDAEVLSSRVRRRVLPLLRLPRGAVGGQRVPRCTTGCTSSKTPSSSRSSTSRPASRSPTASSGRSCITELYKTGSPQFRYNIMDLSYLYPRGQCGCGSWLRKIGPFAGRGDNMVKLRGVNVWPEGVGEIAGSVPGTLPDYFVTRPPGRRPRRDDHPGRVGPSRRPSSTRSPPRSRPASSHSSASPSPPRSWSAGRSTTSPSWPRHPSRSGSPTCEAAV